MHGGRERERRRRGDRGQDAERGEHRAGARAGRVARLDAVRERRPGRDDACRRSAAPFQFQATSAPLPLVLATGAPCASSTVTVQPAPPRTRARNAIGTSAPVSFVPSPGGVARGVHDLGRAGRLRGGCDPVERRVDERCPGSRWHCASRCPLTTRSDTLLPAAKRSLPPEIIVACPSGSTCATSSRHAIRLTSASRAASVSGASEPFPITAMPTLPVLKPSRVRADHRAVDAAGAALEDAAVGVDEEVVADVVPAVRAHVVGVDRADDRRARRLARSRSACRCGARRPSAPRRRSAAPRGAATRPRPSPAREMIDG